MGLTNKQKLFVEHYLQCWNATEAARQAGYAGDDVTLASIGYENLRKPKIEEIVSERIAQVAMGADECLLRLGQQARGDLGDFAQAFETDDEAIVVTSWYILKRAKELGISHLIKKVKDTQHGVELELHPVQHALELIGKHHGLFTEKHEVSGNIGVSGTWTIEPDTGPRT